MDMASLFFYFFFSQKFVPKDLVDNESTLIEVMAWCWARNEPLSEQMMAKFPNTCMPPQGKIWSVFHSAGSNLISPGPWEWIMASHNEYRQVTNIIPCYNGHCNKKWTDTFFSGLYGFCSWSRQTSLPRYTKGWLSIYCKARTLPWMSARRQTGWVTDWVLIINSFTPVRSEYNFRYVIFKLILVKDGCGTYLLWNCPQINATGPYFWW